MKKSLKFIKCLIIYFTCHLLSMSSTRATKMSPKLAARLHDAIEATSIDEVRATALTNCKQSYYYGEILRGYEKDFLLRFRQEGETLMPQVQEYLLSLGMSAKERSDLKFLQEVTVDEVDRMVSVNIEFLDDFLQTCKLTCQSLNKASASEIEESINKIKVLSFDVKIKLFSTAKDMASMFLEFYDFIRAMTMDSELHEITYAVEGLFEDFSDMLIKQKVTIIMGRKKFITGKINLINKLGDLAYKLNSIRK